MKFTKYLSAINFIKKIDRWLRPSSSSNNEVPSSIPMRIGVLRRRKIVKIGGVFDRHQRAKAREMRQGWKWLQRIIAGVAALIFALIPTVASANIAISLNPTNATILSTLTGANVTLSNLVLSQGASPAVVSPVIAAGPRSITIFSGGLTGGAGPNIGIDTGVALVTGDARTAPGANRFTSVTTATIGSTSDADLNTVDTPAFDTTSISLKVVPQGNFLGIKFLFASDEYNEFVCTGYNDAMGIFVSGTGITGTQNIAKIGLTTASLVPLTINRVNNGVAGSYSTNPGTVGDPLRTAPCTLTNSAFFVSNISEAETNYSPNRASTTATQSSFTNLEYDGFTIPVEAVVAVTPGQTYTVKIAIADIGDAQWDSAVFVEKIRSFNLDFGDAPDTYSTNIVNGSILLPGPARHPTPIGSSAPLYLGAVAPDAENTVTPATSPNAANYDDTVASPAIDDEDAFSGNDLFIATGITNYTIPNIPVNNNLAANATLMGWIDFNKNGVFDAAELATATVAPNATTANLSWSGFTAPTVGTSYARFRITTDASLIATPSPAGLGIDGEVEDYRVKFDTKANIGAKIVLVKRITAIKQAGTSTWVRTANPNEPSATATRLDGVVQNTANDAATINWPSTTYLLGAVNAGKIKPGDELEYTIYYLNAQTQGTSATSLKICDPIRGNQTYTAGSMSLSAGGATAIGLTDAVDGATGADRANAYGKAALPAVVVAPTDCNIGGTGYAVPAADRNNGGVAIQLTGTGATNQANLLKIPGATAAATPTASYGWFRFTTKVDP